MSASLENNPSGLIFDIQRYSLDDGPGIRTTVFLKGCPLRCRWCHNPESLRPEPEIGFRGERCLDCRACLGVCPKEAIVFEESRRIDFSQCDACGACTEVCPTRALFKIGRRYSLAELVAEVQRDAVFYEESHGGVTLSGGEPTQQFEFVLAFLRACKEVGLDTAIETNGCTTTEKLTALLPHIDRMYFDLKIISPREHRRLTGADNHQILQNARVLAATGAPVIFRMPVIPGMTTTRANIRAIAEFLNDLDVAELELCPYQDSWLNKLSWLSESRSTHDLPEAMSTEETLAVVEAFSLEGIRATPLEGDLAVSQSRNIREEGLPDS